MYLGVVFAGFAENVDHLAARIFCVVGPRCDVYDCLVARLAPLELVAGDEDVAGEIFRIGFQKSYILIDLKRADKCLFFRLDDAGHLGFRFLAAATCRNVDFNPVAVERVHRIAFGNENRFAVGIGYHTVLAV